MFAHDQERAARELLRVVRVGGKIALANWTPEGFVGRLLVAVGKHAPPPMGVASPVYWGNEARLRELFPEAKRFVTRRREFSFRYESSAHFLAVFRRCYGPLREAYSALDEQRQALLTADLRELLEQSRRRDLPRSLVVPAEYLEVVLER